MKRGIGIGNARSRVRFERRFRESERQADAGGAPAEALDSAVLDKVRPKIISHEEGVASFNEAPSRYQ
jgi:hypothetical protein